MHGVENTKFVIFSFSTELQVVSMVARSNELLTVMRSGSDRASCIWAESVWVLG